MVRTSFRLCQATTEESTLLAKLVGDALVPPATKTRNLKDLPPEVKETSTVSVYWGYNLAVGAEPTLLSNEATTFAARLVTVPNPVRSTMSVPSCSLLKTVVAASGAMPAFST